MKITIEKTENDIRITDDFTKGSDISLMAGMLEFAKFKLLHDHNVRNDKKQSEKKEGGE